MSLKKYFELDIDYLVERLRSVTQSFPIPMSVQIAQQYPGNPFPVLVSCLLSLQAQDKVTLPIAQKLSVLAPTPEKLLQISFPELEAMICSINYYKTKARSLHVVSHTLIERFGGQVPGNLKDLLSIKGIGLKTANLVLAEGFGIPAICVDTHVHRICNVWGMVQTEDPEQTEAELRKILRQKYWIEWNRLLVMVGQNLCKKKFECAQYCVLADLCLQSLKMEASSLKC